MELEGHPTEDIVEELRARGASTHQGSAAGPEKIAYQPDPPRGLWIFLPDRAYETGIDDPLG